MEFGGGTLISMKFFKGTPYSSGVGPMFFKGKLIFYGSLPPGVNAIISINVQGKKKK